MARPELLRSAFVYLICAAGAFGAAPAPLVLLGDKDYPPLAYLEEGVAKGMDVDLARALAGPMQREVRIELVNWSAAQERVLKGEADGLLGLSISDERRGLYDFAAPTFRREFGLVAQGGKNIHRLDDLKGKRVGVTLGGYPAKFLEDRPGFHLVTITNYSDGLDRLVAGSIDALAADLWVASYLIERRNIHGLTIAGKPFATTSGAIAVKKGNLALVHEINQAIDALKADKTLDRIQDEWRPHEMLFASRARVRDWITLIAGAFLVILFAGMGLWIFTLKKQIGIRRSVEMALRGSEERFECAVRGSNDGLWDWNVRTNEVYYAPRFRELLGYESQAEFPMTLETFYSHLHPDDTEQLRTAVQRHLTQRTPYDIEYRLRTRGGDYRWFRARGQAVWNEQGQAVRMAGSITDVTERKNTEQSLRESEGRYRALVECSPEPIAVSVDDRVVYVNPAAVKMMRLDGSNGAARLLGRSIYEFLPASLHEAVRANRREVLQRGVPGPITEGSVIREDGSLVITEAQAVPCIYDGRPAILSLIRDVTQRKQAERALRESEHRLQTLTQAAFEGVGISKDGMIADANDQLVKMLGYNDRSEMIGRPVIDLVAPESRELVRQMMLSGRIAPYEHFALRKDGSAFPVEVCGRSIATEPNHVRLTAVRDITERRRAEVERQQAVIREHRARDEYTRQLIASQEAERARIAKELHDSLGQNLLLIKNRVQLARSQSASAPETRAQLEAIDDLASRAVAEVRQISHDLHPYQLDHLGLKRALEAMIDAAAQSSGVGFERRIDSSDDVFSADAAANVYRIVQESLNNILKHSRAKRATIEIERDVHEVVLRVQDDGEGFDVNSVEGAGLGLRNMTERAHILGGTLKVKSDPARGTRIEVAIPIGEESKENCA